MGGSPSDSIPFLARNDGTERGLVHPERSPFETQPVRSSAFSSAHLHGFSARPRASALVTVRASRYSPWLCALVIHLFFFRGPFGCGLCRKPTREGVPPSWAPVPNRTGISSRATRDRCS